MEKYMKIEKTCPFCGHNFVINVPESCLNGYFEWVVRDKPIQEAMPTLPKVSRECLVSGICPTCQDEFFGMD